MSKETDFKFHSSTVGADEAIHAGFDLKTGDWQAQQDITQFKDQAKLDRDRESYFGKSKSGYRKMATIPDIVAIKILQEHHLDLHDPAFMSDPNNMKKLRTILMSEYRDLLVNT
jgi:hypothetical protein|tara:strand:- start:486 stop:827 length:342 start_codon:yes stop_codon:yes gene_type:complete